MGACAREIQPFEGRLVLRGPQNGTADPPLIQRLFAMEDMAARKAPLCFEIFRGDDFALYDQSRNARRVHGQRVNDASIERIALVGPRAFGEEPWRVVHIT
jgi:hypothetical protein